MWLSVVVKRVSFNPDPRYTAYRASVGNGEERVTIDVLVSSNAIRPDRAESAIKLRIVREINEMPSGRDWTEFLKEIEPLELTGREA
jgi:hypothetical protein